MQYLEREASELYLAITKYHFHIGMVSWSHFLDRLAALKAMCEETDPVYKFARRTLAVEEWETNIDWNSDTIEVFEGSTEDRKRDQFPKEKNRKKGIARNNKDIHFISNLKGLKDWVFHQYDVDFHPSIPHGHYLGKHQPKLDAYLGWIYNGSKQTNRLARNLIIDLWNDKKFRFFSERAIRWYQTEFPQYNWRVNEPLRLPRQRW